MTITKLFADPCQAKHYAAFRPEYPKALYQRIVTSIRCTAPMIALDVGCGTGQATRGLAEHGGFDRVIGIEPNAEQLVNAVPHGKIDYRQGTSDLLPDCEVACVAVAQAAHWFNLSTFYEQVDRVLQPGGALAIWTYGILQFPQHAAIENKVVCELYDTILGPYWTEERHVVEGLYQDLPMIDGKGFRGERIVDEALAIRQDMTREQLVGFLRSWSGYVTYCKRNKVEQFSDGDPVAELDLWLQKHYGDVKKFPTVWPTALLLSTKSLSPTPN